VNGKELNAWRKARGLTVAELARELSEVRFEQISVRTVMNWLYGRPVPAWVERACAALETR